MFGDLLQKEGVQKCILSRLRVNFLRLLTYEASKGLLIDEEWGVWDLAGV
jgi:hypothetical protein